MSDQAPHSNAKKQRQYWYRMHVGECCVCGSNASFRERVYGKRPKSKLKRYKYLTDSYTYDHCVG
jgi:hypothetical protein